MVKVTILDKDPDLKPEMSARTTFLEKATGPAAATAAPRVFVPQQAVVTRDGKPQVFEVKPDNVVRLRAVVVGPAQQGQVLVKEGLTGNEVLVKQPADTLNDGDAVKVKG